MMGDCEENDTNYQSKSKNKTSQVCHVYSNLLEVLFIL